MQLHSCTVPNRICGGTKHVIDTDSHIHTIHICNCNIFIYQSIYLFYLSTYLFTKLSIHPILSYLSSLLSYPILSYPLLSPPLLDSPIYLSIHRSTYPSIYPSVYPSICLLIYLSTIIIIYKYLYNLFDEPSQQQSCRFLVSSSHF